MKNSVGIYLGEFYSSVAIKNKNTEVKIIRNKENEELTRSCVSLIKDEIFVGKTAYSTGLKRNPENTILSVKRLMGGAIKDKMVQEMIVNRKYYKYGITKLKGGTEDAVAILLGGKQYSPEQISAEILKKLKKDAEEKLGGEITHAVVTVPAYFTEKQKNATRIAAQLAGLKVQKLLAEPTAAAISFGVDNLKTGDSKTVLVYDFGGGTFDLSILNIVDGQYMEAGTGGDRWLGGDDIDRALQELVYRKVEQEYNIKNIEEIINVLPKKKKDLFESEMRNQTEEAKKQLSSTKTADIYIDNILEDEHGDIIDIDVQITRNEFENEVKPFIQKSIDLIDELLKEVGYDISMIDSILLIGGTSNIPLVKQMLSKKYGVDKIKISEKPMLAVAEGAGILSHRLGLGEEIFESNQSYSTNHNYFIEPQTKDVGIDYLKIIEKQMPLPISISIAYKKQPSDEVIKRISIFTDVEGGEIEIMSEVFIFFGRYSHSGTELIFEISLDENELFNSIYWHIKGKNDRRKAIITRGQKDSRCLSTLEHIINSITADNLSKKEKANSINNIRRLLNKYDITNIESPMSNVWSEIEFQIKNYYDEISKN